MIIAVVVVITIIHNKIKITYKSQTILQLMVIMSCF